MDQRPVLSEGQPKSLHQLAFSLIKFKKGLRKKLRNLLFKFKTFYFNLFHMVLFHTVGHSTVYLKTAYPAISDMSMRVFPLTLQQ